MKTKPMDMKPKTYNELTRDDFQKLESMLADFLASFTIYINDHAVEIFKVALSDDNYSYKDEATLYAVVSETAEIFLGEWLPFEDSEVLDLIQKIAAVGHSPDAKGVGSDSKLMDLVAWFIANEAMHNITTAANNNLELPAGIIDNNQ